MDFTCGGVLRTDSSKIARVFTAALSEALAEGMTWSQLRDALNNAANDDECPEEFWASEVSIDAAAEPEEPKGPRKQLSVPERAQATDRARELILSEGSITKAQLIEELGPEFPAASAAAWTGIIKRLVDSKAISDLGSDPSHQGKGKPPKLYGPPTKATKKKTAKKKSKKKS